MHKPKHNISYKAGLLLIGFLFSFGVVKANHIMELSLSYTHVSGTLYDISAVATFACESEGNADPFLVVYDTSSCTAGLNPIILTQDNIVVRNRSCISGVTTC
ncbi:MAG: hypothetical protein HRT72_07010, partial [Flavobacteriales bacterium]|nr:hypothetical protein [Flavobacteriales bacterium]